MTARPTLTIAVIELVGGAALQRALLEAVDLVSAAGFGRVIAATRIDQAQPNSVSAHDIPFVSGNTIPLRRRAALDAIDTDLVVLVEDSIILNANWIENLLGVFENPSVAAAWGPVEISTSLASRYRALGIFEYGRFGSAMKDASSGSQDSRTRIISGACMAFRTEALTTQQQATDRGFVEHDVAEQLLAQGQEIVRSEGLRVVYSEPDIYGALLATRAAHGRLYASTHLETRPFPERVVFAAKTFLLPLILTMRALRCRTPGLSLAGVTSECGWILAMASAWSFGELVGALAGPGDSAGAWR